MSKHSKEVEDKMNLTKKFNSLKIKAQSFWLGLSLFLTGIPVTASAAGRNPFSKTKDLAQKGTTEIQGIAVYVAGFALVVTAVVYMVGGRELKAAMKKHWFHIAIAIVVIFAGVSGIEWLRDFVTN